MPSTWGALRRRILTPNDKAARLDVRGFHEKNAPARELLETVGRTFLVGYGYAAEARTSAEAEENLETIPRQFRGFAYEGAGMGYAIRDGLPLGGDRHVEEFLAGRGADHVYMVWIGVGWAMARLPRFRWKRITVADPLMRWLVLDGYGFHQTYFKTQKYAHEQYQEAAFPWPAGGPQWYANRAIDQGIGRALWFVNGTDPERTVAMIDGFAAARRSDLYAGAGLAATYAGGVDEAELRRFWELAGEYRPWVAQGSAFAATARIEAGLVIPHTELASQVFCGLTAAKASQVSSDNRPDRQVEQDVPLYEIWRQNIADAFTDLGRC